MTYLADVWLNGFKIGKHEGGHLPFEFDVTGSLREEGNLLVVRVDGRQAPDRVPPGNLESDPEIPGQDYSNVCYPSTNYDFFPFCGIDRPVMLYSLPEQGIDDLTVETGIEGSAGWVSVKIAAQFVSQPVEALLSLSGQGSPVKVQGILEKGGTLRISVAEARLWSPREPNLYRLGIELLRNRVVYDRYSLEIGIRTIRVEGDRLLLNGEPVFLKGFGRHEDFPVTGRGLLPAVIVKDYALMGWVGANSFRTTHYPYSEEMMDLADRLGFMVIDETPAVGLIFRDKGLERRRQLCAQFTRELIARDKNHPSVILWSLANEPMSVEPAAGEFFWGLYDLAKAQDATRPVTVVSYIGAKEQSFEFLDVVCWNRYNAWYTQAGRIAEGAALLSGELDELYARFHKPVLLTEFGADTIPGVHAQPAEMFSEEYQAEFIEGYLKVLETKPYVVGAHVWNLCDFKTGQAVRRMGGMNYKGVFTRDRKPKMAAHKLRELWGGRGGRR